jgi:hypothetical protein
VLGNGDSVTLKKAQALSSSFNGDVKPTSSSKRKNERFSFMAKPRPEPQWTIVSRMPL